jgi:hypothetical protein
MHKRRLGSKAFGRYKASASPYQAPKASGTWVTERALPSSTHVREKKAVIRGCMSGRVSGAAPAA